MSTITKYVLVDQYGADFDHEYDALDEAKAVAVRYGDHAVIERTYVFDDSELVWTPDGSNTWPPESTLDGD